MFCDSFSSRGRGGEDLVLCLFFSFSLGTKCLLVKKKGITIPLCENFNLLIFFGLLHPSRLKV